MREFRRPTYIAAIALLAGCSAKPSTGDVTAPTGTVTPADTSDIRILFVGNSHTWSHDLPSLVCKMIRFQHPEQSVYSQVIGVAFLVDTVRDSRCSEELANHSWNYVVLQAQKISGSGRYEYSRNEGIELAKRAKAAGAAVFFFAEWGRKGVDGEAERYQKVYQQMADAAAADVVPIGAAWDIALGERPDLALHDADGNHESSLGAFLTACIIVGRLTGESPARLASFPYLKFDAETREFLADVAAKTLAVRSEAQ